MLGTSLNRYLQEDLTVPAVPAPTTNMGPPPSRKRRSPSHSREEASSSVSEEGEGEERRARREPAPLPQPVLRAADEGTDDEFTPPKTYSSLHTAATDAIDEYLDDQLYGRHTHDDCFICDFQERYEKEVRASGGQTSVLLEGSYAYNLMREYHKEHPFTGRGKKAKALTKIYKLHVWNPAVKANNGRPPRHLPQPDERKFVEHLTLFSLDPTSINMECIHAIRQLIWTFGSKLVVDGAPDAVNGRLVLNATGELSKLIDKQVKLAGENFNSPFALDPERVLAFASTRPLDAIRSQATSDALGGATATNNQTAVSMVTAQRPSFGEISSVSVVEEEEEEESDSEDSGAMNID